MKKIISYRQGDLLFVKVDYVPSFHIKQKHLIIAEGEATGHKHEIIGDTAILFEPENRTTDRMSAGNVRNNNKFLRILENSDVIHNEHDTITLPKGIYQVIQQREYTPSQQGGRNVND